MSCTTQGEGLITAVTMVDYNMHACVSIGVVVAGLILSFFVFSHPTILPYHIDELLD